MKYVIHRRTQQVLKVEDTLPNGNWLAFTGTEYCIISEHDAYDDVYEANAEETKDPLTLHVMEKLKDYPTHEKFELGLSLWTVSTGGHHEAVNYLFSQGWFCVNKFEDRHHTADIDIIWVFEYKGHE